MSCTTSKNNTYKLHISPLTVYRVNDETITYEKFVQLQTEGKIKKILPKIKLEKGGDNDEQKMEFSLIECIITLY